jgi:hypothetical protein
MSSRVSGILVLSIVFGCLAYAGPYGQLGVNGFIDPDTWRHAGPAEPNAALNPVFRGWATSVVEYVPADQVWSGPGVWNDPNKALGPATGRNSDIVSLGELETSEIAAAVPPGSITLGFGDPADPNDAGAIADRQGYDFVVFENAFVSRLTTPGGSLGGQMMAELAYVEVSSNGLDFARFASISLTPEPVGAYGTIEVSNVRNLAGKHANAYGVCTSTPFDLSDLADHPDVVSGLVDVNAIRHVRIVDVPGSGDYCDRASEHIDPGTYPMWAGYPEDHAIFDAWPTRGSGGFDLEAVGVLHEQEYAADINLDGRVDLADLAMMASAWRTHFGQDGWIARCDLAQPKNRIVDARDFAVLAAQWRQTEAWRAAFEGE